METSESRKLCQRSKWPCWHGCSKRAAPTQVFPHNLRDKSPEPIGYEISGGGSDLLVKERVRYDFGSILLERPRNYNNEWYATTWNLLWLATFCFCSLVEFWYCLIRSVGMCKHVQHCVILSSSTVLKKCNININILYKQLFNVQISLPSDSNQLGIYKAWLFAGNYF